MKKLIFALALVAVASTASTPAVAKSPNAKCGLINWFWLDWQPCRPA